MNGVAVAIIVAAILWYVVTPDRVVNVWSIIVKIIFFFPTTYYRLRVFMINKERK